MARKPRQTVEDLKDEITELKLSDIRKDIVSLKEYLRDSNQITETKIDELIVHVKTTNGSVAKVTEQTAMFEMNQDRHKMEDARQWEKLSKIDKETETLRWIFKAPKLVLIILIALMYSMAVPEIRVWFGDLLKLVF